MEEKYHIKLSVLLESLEYCSDVESDGYYAVRGTGEMIKYGEDLSEGYDGNDVVWNYLESRESLHLPTLNDLDKASPNWDREVTNKYIDEKISDAKQKKLLTKAYTAILGNRIVPSFPGSTKFRKELQELGRMDEWNQYIMEASEARRLEYLTAWCQEHDVEIEYDV